MRKVPTAANQRDNVVVKAKAVARIRVGYCSGSQMVKTAKLAPPSPRIGRKTNMAAIDCSG